MGEQRITAGSFSRVYDFERCAAKARFKYVDRIPEPPNPYSERGIAVHKNHEQFVKGETDEILPDLEKFRPEMVSLRERYKAGHVEIEEEWAFDRDWKKRDWRDYENVRMRMKLDAMVHLSPTLGLVIDVKTGRRFGNEIKHAEQGQLYAGAAFLRYPTKERVLVEMHYVDQKDDDRLSQVEYSPQFGAKAIVSFEKRLDKMIAATVFPPRPNILNCRYCSYGRHKGNGHCKVSA